uniref:DDE_3 domain-containing protein n=1 Tax=Rhabditophanes sp. KR3021 TaxID=114890 RepID=A0AC35U2G4_9BILA
MGGDSSMMWDASLIHTNSVNYQTLLSKNFLPHLAKFKRRKAIFMQDNASCHRAVSTLKWFEDQKLKVMKWPPYSPDLNPMENLWAILPKWFMLGTGSFPMLKSSRRCWKNIPQTTMTNLVDSIPQRIYKLIEKRALVQAINC